MKPVTFADRIGEDILLTIPRVHPTNYQRVKLIGVESGGLWIESQEVTNAILQARGLASGPKTPVFFFPYHEIAFAIASTSGPALNEKAFGL